MQSSNVISILEQSTEERPKTLAEAIYKKLRQDILSVRLKPGAKLRFADLKESYAAGNSTLREALSRLAADRLVIAESQRGFRVAPVSQAELLDITRLRADIETVALQSSIENGNDAWEAHVVAALHRLSKVHARTGATPTLLTEEGTQLHKVFHMSLLAACPSMWRLRVVDLLYDHSERYRRLATSHLPRGRDSMREHREIMEAALARNKQRAVALLNRHLEKTAETVSAVEELWAPKPSRRRDGEAPTLSARRRRASDRRRLRPRAES
jgi:DNA-binding GntR family transcriptional regulator